ncbi:MAG TPA: lipopolysaccharide biosynthesis protein [Acidimicrobiia bacterium]|nr:lipopolysaccharide biosynthesis protein [Acidimicrobiia bacterium]
MDIRSTAVPDGEVARRAVRAVMWNYVSWFLTKALVLVSTAILARLLSPEEFGVVGFATVAITLLSVLQDLGLGGALIQRRGDIEGSADTVFTINLLLGSVLALATALCAPLVAAWFDEPSVTPLLRVLGLGFVVNALASTHITLLQRRLEFSKKVVPDVGRAVVRGGTAIALALAGAGPMSLVAGQLAGSTAAAVLAWRVEPWRPRLVVERRLVRPLASFGLPLLGVDVVHALAGNLDYLIVGTVMGSTALGLYTLAYRLPELLLLGAVNVLNKAVFPAFAAVQDRRDALRRGFLSSIGYVQMLVVPLGLGMIIAAEPLVLITLGGDWTDVIPVVRVVAAFAMVSTVMVSDGDVYKAIGRPGLLLRFALVKIVLLVPALLVGAQHGLVWVGAAHLATALVIKGARAVVVARLLDLPMSAIGRRLAPSAVAGTALVLASLPTLRATASLDPWAQLLLTAAAGSAAYVAVLVRLEHRSLHALRRLLTRYRLESGRNATDECARDIEEHA